MTTLHLLLDLPSLERLGARQRRGDAVLDLSLITPSEPLRRATRAAHPEVAWLDHDMASDATFALMRDAYLEETSALPNRPLLEGKSLHQLLFHEDGERRMPLWWFTRMSERRFRLDVLPQHLLRRFWLLERGGLERLREEAGHRRLLLWGDDARTTRMLAMLLSRAGHHVASHAVESSTGATYPCLFASAAPVRSWRATARSRTNILLRHARLEREAAEVARRRQASPTATGANILLATFANDWHEPAGSGRTKHRYFHELAEALQAQEHRVAWLPLGLLPGSIRKLDRALSRQPLPVDGAAFSTPARAITELLRSISRTRTRFDRVRDALVGHPHLTLFGEDISPWLIEELEHLVDTELFKFLWQKGIVERACARHDASVLIYRDEFYQLGRATSWAHTPGTRKWAVQHGLITQDHWTYLYTARDHRAPHGIPAPDRFFTYGSYTTTLMTRWGAPEKMCATIGSLRHDVMIARAAMQDELPALRRGDLKLPEGLPLCVVCTQLISQVPGWIERLVGGLRRAGIAAHIAIKQHHFHRADELIHETFAALDWSDYSVHTQHLEELLRLADVALTENSTTGVESLIFGTPLICYGEPERYESFPYVTDGGAWSGKDVETMSRSLAAILVGEGEGDDFEMRREAFLSRHLANMRRPALESFLDELDGALRRESQRII